MFIHRYEHFLIVTSYILKPFSCFQTLYKTQVKELKEEIEEKNRQTQEAFRKVQDMYSEK